MDTVLNAEAGVTREAGVDKLTECYRGELSAVETYELALKSINDVGVHKALQELLTSHSRRVDAIRERMSSQGIEVPESSGVWGAFAKLVQTGADLLNEKTAIASLEEGEDHGLALYSEDLSSCSPDVRNFITTRLLPDQQRSHDLCRSLKKYLKQPS